MLKENKKISVVIVDDHPIVTQGIETILAKEKDLVIAGSFNNGADFLLFLKSNDVDVVLLDISLPDINGIDLCLKIKKINPNICVLALSNHAERTLIMQMIQNGASGYMLKNASVDELKKCIKAGLNGDIAFSNEVRDIIAKPSINELKDRPKITQREKQILRLIAEGKTTIAIAEDLFLSPLTVETHRKNLMQKVNAKNSLELIKIAKEQLLF